MDKKALFHLSVLEKKYSPVLNQIEKLTNDKEQHELHIIDIEKQLQQSLIDHEKDVFRLTEENDKLLTENQKLLQELNISSQDSDQLISRLRSELNSLSDQYAELYEIHTADQQLIQDLKSQLEISQQDLDEKTKSMIHYQILNSNLEKAKNKAVKNLKVFQKSYATLKEETIQHTEQINKHYTKVKSKEEDAKNLIEDYRSALKRMKMLQELNDKISYEYSNIVQSYKTKDERLHSLRLAKKKLENKLKDLENCYITLNSELEIYKDKMSEYAQLKGDCTHSLHVGIDAKLIQSEFKIKVLAGKLEPLLVRNKELEDTLHARDLEIRHLKEVQKILNETLNTRSTVDDNQDFALTLITPRSAASDPPRSILKNSISTRSFHTFLSPASNFTPTHPSNQAAYLASRQGKRFHKALSSASISSSLDLITPLSLNLDKIYKEQPSENPLQ